MNNTLPGSSWKNSIPWQIICLLDTYFELVLMSFMLISITLIMFYQVVMRYIANNSLIWAEETCRYIFIWFSCLSFSYTVSKDNHLKIDFIYNLFPKLGTIILDVISYILQIFFALMLIYGGPTLIARVARNGQTSAALRIPMQYIYVSLYIGALLMLVRIIQQIIKKILVRRKAV